MNDQNTETCTWCGEKFTPDLPGVTMCDDCLNSE